MRADTKVCPNENKNIGILGNKENLIYYKPRIESMCSPLAF